MKKNNIPVIRNEWGVPIWLSPLRRHRLLKLAGKGFNHKALYSQYCILISEGLCGWAIGFAYLTPAGKQLLEEMEAS